MATSEPVGLVGGRSRWRHKASGVIGLVYSRQSTFDGVTVTMECLSDPREAEHPDLVPFRVDVTSTLQRCCEMQGMATAWANGPCPIHGEPFYLVRHETQPLTFPADLLTVEWEKVDV